MAESEHQELDLLLERLCEDMLEEPAQHRLVELLDASEACRHRYLDTLELHAALWTAGGAGTSISPVLTEVRSGYAATDVQREIEERDREILTPQTASRFNAFVPPIVVDVSPSARPSLFSLNSPLGNFLMSYSASAIIIAIAVFVGWSFKMSEVTGTRHVPSQSALQISTAPTSGNGARSEPATFVGRITGLADCKWLDQGTRTQERSAVYIGRKYALSAGFLEITYDSGAKVILQGPCVYRVDSPCSGFLEVGKLTANVGARGKGRGTMDSGQWSVASDGRGEGRGKREEISGEWRVASGENSGHSSPQPLASSPSSNPQSLIPNPLFTVTTPTAIVTDLGTEFGVEVEKSGTTRSHVFKGRVQVRNSNSRGPTARGDSALHAGAGGDDQVVELTANQSASVIANSDGKATLTRNARAPAGAFVRAMPRSAFRGISRAANIGDRPGDLAGLGENVTYACVVNAAGQVVVHSPTVANTVHVFLQGKGKLMDLGTLEPGESFPTAREMAERIATVESNETARAFLHIPGKGMKSLGTLGGPTSRATRINAAGQVVGYSTTAAGATHAFLYSSGKMHDLGTLGGDTSFATDIDASGRVVGASRTASGVIHAFLYTRGAGMKDLGALGGAKANSWALAIVDGGPVSGCSEGEGGHRHSFYYVADKGMNRLGDLDVGNQVICCLNGRISARGWSSANSGTDSPRPAKAPDPQAPDTREERRTSP